MEELIELEVALIQRLIFVHRHITGRPCSDGVLVEETAVEARGDRQGRRVKHGDKGRGGEGQVAVQLSLSQLPLQHHVLQLLVCEGSPLPHAGADGGTGEVCLVTLRLL